MKKVLLIAVLTVTLLIFVNSHAADKSNWNDGFYIGVQIGYTDGKAEHTFSNNAPSGDSEPNGFDKGIFVGYQKLVDKFMIGVELDYNKPNVDGDFTNTSGTTSGGVVEFDSMYSIRGKIGYPINKLSIVPYITGGFAYSDVDIQGGPSATPTAGRYSASYTGWVAGIGVERSIFNRLTARLEYRYADFGTESGNLSPGFPAVQMPVDLKTQSILFGLYYQF